MCENLRKVSYLVLDYEDESHRGAEKQNADLMPGDPMEISETVRSSSVAHRQDSMCLPEGTAARAVDLEPSGKRRAQSRMQEPGVQKNSSFPFHKQQRLID